MSEAIVEALNALVPSGASGGGLARGRRMLRWVEAGAGPGPIIVLVAARGDTALEWATILPALAARWRVLAYDRAGLGASDPVTPLTLEGQIEDLAAVVAEVGPAVLVGHSWGGLLVQLVALGHPSGVAGMVLIDPSHEDIWAAVPWPIRAIEAAVGIGAVMAHRLGLSARIATRMGQSHARRCSDDPLTRALIVDAYVTCYASGDQARTIRAEGRLASRSVPVVRAARATSRLPDVPVMLLSATTGLPPRARARASAIHARLAASASRGDQIVVDDAGHYIHHDQPREVVRAISTVFTMITGEGAAT